MYTTYIEAQSMRETFFNKSSGLFDYETPLEN